MIIIMGKEKLMLRCSGVPMFFLWRGHMKPREPHLLQSHSSADLWNKENQGYLVVVLLLFWLPWPDQDYKNTVEGGRCFCAHTVGEKAWFTYDLSLLIALWASFACYPVEFCQSGWKSQSKGRGKASPSRVESPKQGSQVCTNNRQHVCCCFYWNISFTPLFIGNPQSPQSLGWMMTGRRFEVRKLETLLCSLSQQRVQQVEWAVWAESKDSSQISLHRREEG